MKDQLHVVLLKDTLTNTNDLYYLFVENYIRIDLSDILHLGILCKV